MSHRQSEGFQVSVHGHRGSKGTHPENSMLAFEEALDAHADFIEFDVRESADGEFIIFHDPVLHRSGIAAKVSKLTAAELAKIVLRNGEPIPTVIELVENMGSSIGFNLEIKTVENVAGLLETVAPVADLLISSFDHKVLRRVREVSDTPTGYLFNLPFPRRIQTAKAIGVNAMHPMIRFLTRRSVRKYQAEGFMVNTWTTTNASLDKKAASLDVDGIISDFPRDTIARLRSWTRVLEGE